MEQLTSEPRFYKIPADLLQAVVNYMAERPYKEVGGAMPRLLALEPVAEEAPANKVDGGP